MGTARNATFNVVVINLVGYFAIVLFAVATRDDDPTVPEGVLLLIVGIFIPSIVFIVNVTWLNASNGRRRPKTNEAGRVCFALVAVTLVILFVAMVVLGFWLEIKQAEPAPMHSDPAGTLKPFPFNRAASWVAVLFAMVMCLTSLAGVFTDPAPVKESNAGTRPAAGGQ